jgi:hypothetical protein
VLNNLIELNQVSWKVSNWLEAKSTQRAEVATMAEMTTDGTRPLPPVTIYKPKGEQIVIEAPVGKYSPWFTLPLNVDWAIMPQGDAWCETASGKRFRVGPNLPVKDWGELNNVKDSQLRWTSAGRISVPIIITYKSR